ncbi:MAG: MOSC domain-containing protein [Marmoricola sp.]
MQVVELTRYPVKSLGPEPLTEVALDTRGLVGDRGWAVYTEDGGIGSGKTTRRFRRVPGLLDVPVRSTADGPPEVDLDGWCSVDDPSAAARLSERVGQPVTMRAEGDVPHHDDCPVHLVTTAALRQVQDLYGDHVGPGRFRANLVVDVPGTGFAEDDWVGRELHVGEVVLSIGPGMPRCVMVDLGHDAAGLAEAPGLLRLLGRAHDVDLGVQATVLRSGVLRVGDEVRLA